MAERDLKALRGMADPPLDRRTVVADVERLADSVRSTIQGMEPEA